MVHEASYRSVQRLATESARLQRGRASDVCKRSPESSPRRLNLRAPFPASAASINRVASGARDMQDSHWLLLCLSPRATYCIRERRQRSSLINRVAAGARDMQDSHCVPAPLPARNCCIRRPGPAAAFPSAVLQVGRTAPSFPPESTLLWYLPQCFDSGGIGARLPNWNQTCTQAASLQADLGIPQPPIVYADRSESAHLINVGYETRRFAHLRYFPLKWSWKDEVMMQGLARVKFRRRGWYIHGKYEETVFDCRWRRSGDRSRVC
ncbi:hypothetical protein C8R44DRAFT_858764 [Mycena epipterygia]|nr:hypothetical protein C8R44DRAFT_858764 [Mycena epipterygia]